MEMARRGEEEEEQSQSQEEEQEGGEYGRECGSCGRVSGRVSRADATLGGCAGHYTSLESLIRYWVIIYII